MALTVVGRVVERVRRDQRSAMQIGRQHERNAVCARVSVSVCVSVTQSRTIKTTVKGHSLTSHCFTAAKLRPQIACNLPVNPITHGLRLRLLLLLVLGEVIRKVAILEHTKRISYVILNSRCLTYQIVATRIVSGTERD